MPKVIRLEELDQMTEIIGRFPDGAALDDIAANLGDGLSRRTLQRRLADLVRQGRIVAGRERKAFNLDSAVASRIQVEVPSRRIVCRGGSETHPYGAPVG